MKVDVLRTKLSEHVGHNIEVGTEMRLVDLGNVDVFYTHNKHKEGDRFRIGEITQNTNNVHDMVLRVFYKNVDIKNSRFQIAINMDDEDEINEFKEMFDFDVDFIIEDESQRIAFAEEMREAFNKFHKMRKQAHKYDLNVGDYGSDGKLTITRIVTEEY